MIMFAAVSAPGKRDYFSGFVDVEQRETTIGLKACVPWTDVVCLMTCLVNETNESIRVLF